MPPLARTVDTRIESPIVRPVMPELDAIRGLAILMVFTYHAFSFGPAAANRSLAGHAFLAAVHYGWSGVNLFFVLSGFLITGILLDSRSVPRFYARFYYRRALRILPAYYTILAVLLVLSQVQFIERKTTLAFAVLSFFYLSNVTPLLGVPMCYGPLWSLAVEEHFYLLWPAAVKRLSSRSLIWASALICLAVPVLRVYAVSRGGLWWGPYTWLSADALALGALLAIFARSQLASRRNLLRVAVLGLVAGGLGALIGWLVAGPLQIALKASAINYLAFGVVGGVLWLGTGPSRQRFQSRTLAFYGYISYGLYLIHLIVISVYDDAAAALAPRFSVGTSLTLAFLRFGVTLALATTLALVSRRTFEQYFLGLKDRFFEGKGVAGRPRLRPDLATNSVNPVGGEQSPQ